MSPPAEPLRVALVTYSTKPRGGVVHTLQLAEALGSAGAEVHVLALGDPDEGFFRPLRVPSTIFPAPDWHEDLEQRVFAAVDALHAGLARTPWRSFDLLHTQDCIAARAATRLRDEGAALPVLRTVHHVDDFTTPALIECQERAVIDPDHVLVVSDHWRRILSDDYGVGASVVTNGTDVARFARPAVPPAEALRARLGADGRTLFLTVGGLEPRKGSYELVEALAKVRASVDPPPVLAVVGGHSFQDHRPYRERVLARADELGLDVGRDMILLGTVPDEELPGWYQAADVFVFPSHKEGWGMAVLEAMAAGAPVITSDIPVFREFLADGEGALMVPVGDAAALAAAMRRLASEPRLHRRLAADAPTVAGRFTWDACAEQHLEVYRGVLAGAPTAG